MKDKFQGCLIGGAVGDALGYPVEFMSISQIRAKYGERGISRYELIKGVARISDDTQMTLFTANAALFGFTRIKLRGIGAIWPEYYWMAYRDWYKTQIYASQNEMRSNEHEKPYLWLCGIDELYSRRAPGTTCMNAIENNKMGTIEDPINNSKGCGGVMRVAPVGLFHRLLDANEHRPDWGHSYSSDDEIVLTGARVAALTHGHPLGYITAGTFSYLIADIVKDERPKRLQACVERSIQITKQCFPDSAGCDYLCQLLERAVNFACQNIEDVLAIDLLGQGWVAEEALAIAVYCALKYCDDFERAIVAAVNHSGDSDSTGAICGNILGAYLGLSAIPLYYIEKLEIGDVILDIANDLYIGCPVDEYTVDDTAMQQRWLRKYVEFYNTGVYPRIVKGLDISRITPNMVKKLDDNEIFVFGSNLGGRHGGGAARTALRWGAIPGQGVGAQGQTYAIPTMFGSVNAIKPYIDEFIGYAKTYSRMRFLVTELGCGIAGFTPADIAPLFTDAVDVYNIHLPGSFWEILKKTNPFAGFQ